MGVKSWYHFSLKSTEKEVTDSNELAVATHLHSKDKKAKMSQMLNMESSLL